MRTRNEIEVLAPAGSFECLEAAIKNGADAVYLGGEMFGARAYAGNFSHDELIKALDYAHFFGKKIFLTVNTLVKEDELNQLAKYLVPFYEHGLDGVIVQDLGAISVIRTHFPKMEIHASTQMTITGVGGAKIAKELGAVRVVPARELSLEEISSIKKETGLDIECFVHGALCYCYSGQCLMSSMIGGRSGNRGRCAGTCRLPFSLDESHKGKHPLSLKDLCTITTLPKILDAGVDSLKVEGRMKGPRYVGEVTRIYCKYVDLYCSGKPYKVNQEDMNILMELFHRGGFTEGYYEEYNGLDMMSMDTPGHQGIYVGKIDSLNKGTVSFYTKKSIHKGDVLKISIGLEESVDLTSPKDWKRGDLVTLNGQKMRKMSKGFGIYRMQNAKLFRQIDENLAKKKQENLKGKIKLKTGKNVTLYVDNGEFSACVEGQEMERAKGQAATKEEVETLLKKTGTTPYRFTSLDIDMDEGLFVPDALLKRLRKEAFQKLDERKLESTKRQYIRPEIASSKDKEVLGDYKICAAIESLDTLDAILKDHNIARIYLPLIELIKVADAKNVLKKVKNTKKECFLALPQIARKKQIDLFNKHKDIVWSEDVDGILVRSLEEINWLKNTGYGKILVFDSMLYGYNKKALKEYKKIYKKEIQFVYPLECNEKELKELDTREELFFYGHVPLMVSTQCVKKNLLGCKKEEGFLTLTDRYKKNFYVKNDCTNCINTIYNGSPIWLGQEEGLLEQLNPLRLRLHFTKESKDEVRQVLQAANDVMKGKIVSLKQDVTKGHLKRGIE